MDECDQLIMEMGTAKIMLQLDSWMLVDFENKIDGLVEEKTDVQINNGNVYDLVSNSNDRK